jgi:hypothetical protein
MRFKKLNTILATTLFAVLLWFSVSLTESYRIVVSAPLVISGLPPGKAIASPLPGSVQLTFNEYGWRLAKALWASDIRWVVDLRSMRVERPLTLRDFATQLGWRLAIQPISMVPESLYIVLDDVDSKRVAVIPDVSLSFRDGYGQVGNTVITPDSVSVTGARSLLARIERWQTTLARFEQVRQSIDTTVGVFDSTNALTFTPNKASLRIGVQQFAEKTFDGIPVELISVPQNREVILNSRKIGIVVRGGIEKLSAVEGQSFRAVVDYRVILADTTGIIQPEISFPLGIQIVKRTPERLQYVVRKKY